MRMPAFILAILLLAVPCRAAGLGHDIIWDLGSAAPALWQMNGSSVTSSTYLGINMPTGFVIAGVGDFDGNGTSDVLWTTAQPGGPAFLWLTNSSGGITPVSLAQYGRVPGKAWVADFDGDGKSDILWDNGSGAPVLWRMNGATVTSITYLGGNMPAGWKIAGVGDFSGTGLADVLWTTSTPGGPAYLWMNQGNAQVAGVSLAKYGPVPGKPWIGDFNGDGKADILWDTGGTPILWQMNGAQIAGVSYLGSAMPSAFHIAGVGDFAGTGLADVLWSTGTPGSIGFLWMNGGNLKITPANLAANGLVPGKAWIGTIPPPGGAGGSGSLPGGSGSNPPLPQAGVCGAASGISNISLPPLLNLCAQGTPTTVRGNGPWTWQCVGSAGAPQDSCLAAPGNIVTYDMTGANLLQIKNGIAAAKSLFASNVPAQQNSTVVLKFPAGRFDFSQDTSVNPQVYCTQPGQCIGTNSIDVSNVSPGSAGRLILYGAGMSETTFVFNPDQTPFFGQNTYQVSMIGIHASSDRLKASQGTVVNPPGNTYPANTVVVDIPAGFPGLQTYPAGLYQANVVAADHHGHYLRKYNTDGSTYCHIDWQSPITQQSFGGNYQHPEAAPVQMAGYPNRWQITMDNGLTNPFSDGDVVGIKAESGGGGAYTFKNGSDITFDHMEWTGSARGAFWSTDPGAFTGNVHIYDSSVMRLGPVNGVPICMSTSGGGPQIGQPGGNPTYGNVVDNLYAENTGDDSLAVFNSSNPTLTLGTAIMNSYITDSFARSINLNNSPYPLTNTVVNTTEANCFPGANGPGADSKCLLVSLPLQ